MSAFDDFLKDTGGAQAQGSLSDQFAADLANPNAQVAAPRPRLLGPPQDLSMMDKLLAKVPTGLVNNPAVAGARNMVTAAAAPTVGGAQLIANLFPEPSQNLSGLVTGQKPEGVAGLYNRKIAEMLRKDDAAAKEAGPIASTLNRFTGSMIAPTNLAMASALSPVAGIGGRALQGAAVGGAAGATEPVEVGESGKYWGQKGAQIAIGTAGGAIMQPIIGAVGDKIMQRIAAKGYNPANAAADADEIIARGLSDSGQSVKDIPADQLASLRAEAMKALQAGKQLDGASALRAQDFKAEGIQPTLGWVTRDPRQWEAEQNVRGVKGAGEAVGSVIAGGNRAVTQKVDQYGANASEAATASQKLAQALKGLDDQSSAGVTAEYGKARASAGKDLDVPLVGLAQDYAQTLDRFGDKIPKALQQKFAALGLDPANPSNQKQVFTFEKADQLLKDINVHYGVDRPTDTALNQLNAAVKRAATEVDATGGPFAPAVAAARERFKTLDEVPAMAAAASGKVDDRFVLKSIINNPSTPQVQKLAAMLREQAPDAYEEARQQIGAHLTRAAFGENGAGDKLVKQESYNKALRQLGTGKLEAFFKPEEVDQLKRLGRIASYQVSPPAGAASNYSNTASAMANLLRSVGGFVPVGKGPMQFAGDKITASAALRPEIPVTPNLSLEQRRAMARALTAITGGGASALGGIVGQ